MAEVYWIHLKEHLDILSQGYVGYTNYNVEKRKKEHQYLADCGSSLPLHNAIRKYGGALVYEKVCICSNEYGLWLENALRPDVYIGWNCGSGGRSTRKGTKASEETRKKNAEVARRRVQTYEEKRKRAKSLTGRPVSAETRLKISNGNKGRVLSPAHRNAAISTLQSCRGDRTAILKSAKSRSKWRTGNPDVWVLAEDLYFLWLNRKPRKLKGEITTLTGMSDPSSFDKILKSFKHGWIPMNDEEYILWRNNIKEELNATQPT